MERIKGLSAFCLSLTGTVHCLECETFNPSWSSSKTGREQKQQTPKPDQAQSQEQSHPALLVGVTEV